MSNTITPGMNGSAETTVTEAMLASTVGSGKVSVFSTAMMVAWMEGTAVDVVQPRLEEDQTTVGTGISVSHAAKAASAECSNTPTVSTPTMMV